MKYTISCSLSIWEFNEWQPHSCKLFQGANPHNSHGAGCNTYLGQEGAASHYVVDCTQSIHTITQNYTIMLLHKHSFQSNLMAISMFAYTVHIHTTLEAEHFLHRGPWTHHTHSYTPPTFLSLFISQRTLRHLKLEKASLQICWAGWIKQHAQSSRTVTDCSRVVWAVLSC